MSPATHPSCQVCSPQADLKIPPPLKLERPKWFWLCLWVVSMTNASATLLVGHRGGTAGERPENTLESFDFAYGKGATHIECDLRRTSDQAIVIMHDATVDRTTKGTGAVSSFTLAQIKQLDAWGRMSAWAGKGVKVPMLREVLQLAKDRGRGVFLDIKELGMAAQVRQEVNEVGLSDGQIVLVCADVKMGIEFRPLFPVCDIYAVAGGTGLSWSAGNLAFWVGKGYTGFLFWGTWQSSTDIAWMKTNRMKTMVIGGLPPYAYDLSAAGIEGVMTDYVSGCASAYYKRAYDNWIATMQVDAARAGKTADPDGDGITNEQEFLQGTDPLVANGISPLTPLNTSGIGWERVVQPPLRPKLITFTCETQMQTPPQCVVTAYVSADLVTWTPAPADWLDSTGDHLKVNVPSQLVRRQYVKFVETPVP